MTTVNTDDQSFQRRMERVEGLINQIKAASDPQIKAAAVELVQSLMELHGAGIERMLDIAWESGEAGQHIIDEYGRDDLVSSLLLLYELHPQDTETRIAQAIEKLHPVLALHGSSVELLSLTETSARLRLTCQSGGCGSSAQSLKLSVEEAIYAAAPDLEEVEFDVVEQAAPAGFVPLNKLRGLDHTSQPLTNINHQTILPANNQEATHETETVNGAALTASGHPAGTGSH